MEAVTEEASVEDGVGETAVGVVGEEVEVRFHYTGPCCSRSGPFKSHMQGLPAKDLSTRWIRRPWW